MRAHILAAITAYDTARDRVRDLVTSTEQLAVAAQAGSLSERGDTERFEGSYRSVVDGFNRTLDAVIAPVQEATTVLEQVARRDLTRACRGTTPAITAHQAGPQHGRHYHRRCHARTARRRRERRLGLGSDCGGRVGTLHGSSDQAASLQQVAASLEEMRTMAERNATTSAEARAPDRRRGTSRRGRQGGRHDAAHGSHGGDQECRRRDGAHHQDH